MKSARLSFGEVPEGQVIEKIVEIVNNSNTPVAIIQAIPECGCLVIDFRSISLGPGESLKTKVKFFTQGFSGSVTKSVTFLTTSTVTPELTAELVGVIIPPFIVTPARIVFPDQLSSENSPVRTLKIIAKSNSHDSYRVRTLSSNILIEKIKSGPVSADEYKIHLIPPLPEGDFSSAISIRSTKKDLGGKVVPVYSRIVGPLEVERNVLPFGLVEKDRTYTRDVKLKVIHSGLVIDDDKVETSCECLSTELINGKGGVSVLRVTLDTSKSFDRRLAETVKIRTGESETVLRVSAYLKK